MRVKLTMPCTGPNPKYDWTKTEEQNLFPREIVHHEGKVIEGKFAYILMKNGQAEPEDDEARDWWEKYTGRVAQRQAAVAALKEEQAAAAAEYDDEGDEDDDAAED